MLKIPVLCYHAHIISSNDYAGNAHIALAEDLELIQSCGKRIMPLHWIIDWLEGKRADTELENAVGLSFDDGTLLDFQAVVHPQYGNLPGMLPIIQRFARRYPQDQASVHASCFVISSPLARAQADRYLLHDLNWLTSDWWLKAQASGMISIENHSWDHNMAVATEAMSTPSNSFSGVRTAPQANYQILGSSELIELITGVRPYLFAYPYGDVNDYLALDYLPGTESQSGLRGAFTTTGNHIDRNADRWKLSRYVHGFHWTCSKELRIIIE
ncbi:MAG: polysaccharide deacetylase family protein [Gammaproteobacteria bacterium]|jgi:hypothetical protein|nr:polysaccharide deacetylase family protein [Gammaproteobacteria bacterium]